MSTATVTVVSRGIEHDYGRDAIESNVEHDTETGCWNWTGGRYSLGYGVLYFGSVGRITAHRLSYLLYVGSIPDGYLICHHCDNPPCVNPDHLYAGTPQQNVADMIERGRGVAGRYGAEAHNAHPAELYRAVVSACDCRPAGVTIADVAHEFGLSPWTARAWVRGFRRARERSP